MARHKTSPLEDLITLSSKSPWWAGVSLALISYLILHTYASRPPLMMTKPGDMGAAAVHSLLTALALFGQYVLPFAFGIGALVSAINGWKQKRLYGNVATGAVGIDRLSWSDFERLMSEFYRRKGFQVTREGGSGPDGGVDLLLRKGGDIYLVQCKHWKSYKVGVQQVREFYGVMASRGVAGGYFVTSGVYTKEAIRFAAGLNLELVDGQKLQEMIAIAQQPVLRPVFVNPAPPAVSTTSAPTQVAASPTAPAIPADPSCPQCNAQMSKRTARHGSNAGKEFWGCTLYPRCKGTRAIQETVVIKSGSTPAKPTPLSEIKNNNCPNCGTELVMRKFMSGPREGQHFLACVPCKKGWSADPTNQENI
jgi:restriction system protein